MKYIIKNSDLFINNKLYPEGSEIDLTVDQASGIENYLISLNESGHSEKIEESDSKSHPEPVEGSQLKINKQKTRGTKK